MMALLNGILSADLLAEVAGRPLRTPLTLIHAGQPTGRADKHLLFLAESAAGYPFAVVKWAQGAAATGLLREQAALAQVRALPDPLLRASCPQSWGPYPVGARTMITVERYLPGESAHAQMRTSVWPRRPARRHFGLCMAWYTRFAAATCQSAQPFNDALLEEYIAAPLQALAGLLGAAAVPPAALAATLVAARALRGCSVALAAEHGDLWPANLLLPSAGSGLYVVDWEHFRPVVLPGFDLLLFCTTYALELPWRPFGWASAETALARAYFQHTWMSRQIARWLTQGCTASGLPPALIPVLLPVMLARMVLRRYASPAADEASNPTDSGWLIALRAWWDRPSDNWLETWARSATLG